MKNFVKTLLVTGPLAVSAALTQGCAHDSGKHAGKAAPNAIDALLADTTYPTTQQNGIYAIAGLRK